MPDFYAYDSFWVLLRDLIADLERRDRAFDLVAFAARCGCSAPHLHNLRAGRRAVTPRLRPGLLAALSLPPALNSLFEALMELDRAPPEPRQAVDSKAARASEARARARALVDAARAAEEARRGAPVKVIPTPAVGVGRRRRVSARPDQPGPRRRRLPGPTLALLAELCLAARCPGFKADADWLSPRLRPPLGGPRLAAALRALRAGVQRDAPTPALLRAAIPRARDGLFRGPLDAMYYFHTTWSVPEDRWDALSDLVVPDAIDGPDPSRLHIPPCPVNPPQLHSRSGARTATTPDLPSIWDAYDHRVFLAEWLDAKQRANPRYNKSIFARRAGCDPGHVGNVRDGKRDLLGAYVDGFARALGLAEPESTAWALVVRFKQSKGELERSRLYEQICAHRRQHLGDGAAALFLCNTQRHYVAVRELALAPGFRPDPAWIARTLRPPIHPDDARDALDLLCSVGLLRPDGKGGLRQGDSFVAEDPSRELLALLRAHDYNLYQLQVLEEGPRHARDRYHHGLAAVSAARLRAARALLEAGWAPIRAMLREAEASLSPAAPARLFHAAIALVPAFHARDQVPTSP